MEYRFENGFSGRFLFVRGEENTEEKFDITGLVSLETAYNEIRMSRESIYMLVREVSEMGRRLEKQQLDKNGWLLNPKYIYLRMDGNSDKNMGKIIRFVYYTGKSDLDFEHELRGLAEFIIKNVNYGFWDAIYLAYDFYLHVYRNNYVFDDILV